MSDERPTLLLLHDRGRTAAAWRELAPLFEQRFRVLAPDLPAARELEHARAMLDGGRAGAIGHGVGGAVAQALAVEGRLDAIVVLDAPRADGISDEALASLEIPVLLLWGEDDDVVPISVAQELNDAIPTSTLGVLPGCGHDLLDEAAPTIAPMILEYLRARFLRAPHEHASEGVVRIQLERRPPSLDLEEDERDDWFDVEEEPTR